MPDQLQPLAIQQFSRVLKPGGRFRLLEMVYSKDTQMRKRQERFAPFVEKVYGARFDRNTLAYLQNSESLKVTRCLFADGGGLRKRRGVNIPKKVISSYFS